MEPEKFETIEELCNALRTKSLFNDIIFKHLEYIVLICTGCVKLIFVSIVTTLIFLYFMGYVSLPDSLFGKIIIPCFILFMYALIWGICREFHQRFISNSAECIEYLIKSYFLRYSHYDELDEDTIANIINNDISNAMGIVTNNNQNQ